MAMMCIKTKRLPFAEYCLGRMEHARGARAVREAKDLEEEDARVGCAALHLNMKEEALSLFEGCGRHDLVNRLHQASGDWPRAIEVASAHDRIHLKNTHYVYARHLEDCGDVQGAMREYELAATHATEIPRMIYEMNKVRANNGRRAQRGRLIQGSLHAAFADPPRPSSHARCPCWSGTRP